MKNYSELVNVISRQGLLAASQSHPNVQPWVNAWFRIAQKATWTSLSDVRRSYPNTDQTGQCLIFDVKGNSYRLITTVVWARTIVVAGMPPKAVNGTLFIEHFLTHAEYERDDWKGCCSS